MHALAIAVILTAAGCRGPATRADERPPPVTTPSAGTNPPDSEPPNEDSSPEPERCTLDWALHIHSFSVEDLTDAALAPDGTIVIGGYFIRDLVFGEGEPNETTLAPLYGGSDDAFLARYQPDGTLMWASSVAQGFDFVRASALAIDASGDILVGGRYGDDVVFGAGLPNETTLPRAESNHGDMFLARYRADGTFVWAVPLVSPSLPDELNDISIGADGTIYVAGQYAARLTLGLGTASEVTLEGSSSDRDDEEIWVAAYSPDGDLLWASTAGAAGWVELARGIAATASGAVMTGDIPIAPVVFGVGEPNETTIAGPDAPLAAYLTDGSLGWAKTTGGAYGLDLAAFDSGSLLACGSSGTDSMSVFGTGGVNETVLPENVYYLARYTSGGDLEWVKGATKGANGYSGGTCAAVGEGAVAVAGYYLTEIIFEDGSAHLAHPAATYDDQIEFSTFAASYTHDGEFLCGWAHAGPGENKAAAVVVDNEGGVIVGGWFRDEITIAPNTPEAVTFTSNTGSNDIFLVRYRP